MAYARFQQDGNIDGLTGIAACAPAGGATAAAACPARTRARLPLACAAHARRPDLALMCSPEALAQIELRSESYENAMGRKAVVAARGSSSSAMLGGYSEVGQQRADTSQPVTNVPRVIRAPAVRAQPGAEAPPPSRDRYTGAPAHGVTAPGVPVPGERAGSRVLASSARHTLPAGFAQGLTSPHERGADATSARAHGHLPSPPAPASSSDYTLPQYLPLQSPGVPAGRVSPPPRSAAQPPRAHYGHYGAPQRVLRAADATYPSVSSITEARASVHTSVQQAHAM